MIDVTTRIVGMLQDLMRVLGNRLKDSQGLEDSFHIKVNLPLFAMRLLSLSRPHRLDPASSVLTLARIIQSW